jgi:hypothetical protein
MPDVSLRDQAGHGYHGTHFAPLRENSCRYPEGVFVVLRRTQAWTMFGYTTSWHVLAWRQLPHIKLDPFPIDGLRGPLLLTSLRHLQ